MRRNNMDMCPLEIRIAMLRSGVSQAELARQNRVTPTMINRVIEGLSTSDRVRRAIADAIGLDVQQVWPSVYFEGGPRKPGRPRAPGNKKHPNWPIK